MCCAFIEESVSIKNVAITERVFVKLSTIDDRVLPKGGGAALNKSRHEDVNVDGSLLVLNIRHWDSHGVHFVTE